MTRHCAICWLAGLIVGCGAFAWLNATNSLHNRATFIVEYELDPRADRPVASPVLAELRYGARRDESAHGVALVRLNLPGVVPMTPAREHCIRVERIGRKSDAAGDSQVWINSALADGAIAIPAASQRVRAIDQAIELLEPGAMVQFQGAFEEFSLELLVHAWSGLARVQVDEAEPFEIDLYQPQRAVHAIRFVEATVPIGARAVAASTPHRAVHRLSLRTSDPADRFHVTGLLVRSAHKLRRIPIDPSPPDNAWQFCSARGLSAARHPVLTSVHASMALLLGWAAAALAGCFVTQRAAGSAPRDRVHPVAIWTVLTLLIAQSVFWLAAAWPAILTTDSLHVWQQTQDLWIDTWLSHTYVLFVLMTRQLWDHPATLSIIQIALTLVISAGLFLGFLRRGLRLAFVLPFVLLLVLALPIGAYAMYHTRDALFGLTAAAIAAVVYFWGWRASYRPPCTPDRAVLLALALLVGCHASIRAEGVLLLVLIPLALFMIVRLPLRRVGLFLLISGGVWYALNTPLIRALNIHTSPFYGLTTKLDPLGAIVSGPYNTDGPARDRAIIERIVPLERLQQRHKNIDVYWDGSIDTTKITLRDLQAFEQLYFELVRRNFGKFLANRWDNFARLCCSDDQFNLGELLSIGFDAPLAAHVRDLGLNEYASAPFPALRDLVRNLQLATLEVGRRPIEWRPIVWNLWPAVVLTLAAMFAFRRIPVTATAALLVDYRIAVIFAAAPASMFKYLYDVYFLGFFLVPMALLELGARSPRLARLFLRRATP